MMYRYFLPFLISFAFAQTWAQTTVNGSFVHGGITRTYSFYVPASYVPGQAVPLVIGLHGLGSDGASFAQYRDFRPLADTANFIMVHPDGSTLFGQRFWNYGNILGSTVDDVGFLEALIDTISAQYSINPQRVYCVGMSNGSFMSYLMACESDRFAAVGGVTGSMSVDMYNECNPSHPTPTIHVHGTEDPINPYEGTSTMAGIDAIHRFWVDQNGCDKIPAIIPVSDTDPTDGATAERYLYTGGINGHTVELFKVTGGEHTWPGWPMPGSSDVICMDFDACVEIWRFFSQYELAAVSSIQNQPNQQLNVWPNPTMGLLYLQNENSSVTGIVVMDIQGRVVIQQTGTNILSVDLSHLEEGYYLVKISGDDFYALERVVVLSR